MSANPHDRPGNDVQNAVSKALDDIGRSMTPESTRAALSYVERLSQESGQGDEYWLRVLGIRIELVFDSNAVQELIRRRLKGVESVSLLALQSGFIRAVAPESLDLEIARHAPDIASDCVRSVDDVLREYFRTIRPHVDVIADIDPSVLEAVKQGIRDPDDAPFVALYIERGSLGIVTRDDDIRTYPEVRSYNLVEVAKIHVTYRQQFIVVSVGSLGSVATIASVISLLKAASAAIRLAARHFKTIAIGASVAMLVGYIFKEQIAGFFANSLGLTGERWNRFKSSLRSFWMDVKPVALALLAEGARRIAEAHTQTRELEDGRRRERAIAESSSGEQSGCALTHGVLFRCIALARGGPLSPHDYLATIKRLGVEANPPGDPEAVAAMLRGLPAFVERSDGRFALAT